MDAFDKSRAAEWLGAARSALAQMRSRHDSVSVVGLSMPSTMIFPRWF
jgi:esterase/lipase